MPSYKGSQKIGQIYKGSTKIGKIYKGSTLVYQSAGNVTYVIDSGNSVTKAINNGADAIANAPAASKSGWSFVGWRSDASANGSVHSSYVVNTDGIVLYAVFARTIYLYYDGNGATGGATGTQSGTQYYNNGNSTTCSFQVQGNGFSRPGYAFSCWTDGGTNYNPGGWITIGDSYTLYASWYRITHTVTYTIDSGNSVPKSINDGDDAIANAPAASKDGWSFVGWRSDTAADGSVHGGYTVNSDEIVLYAVFARTIYLYYNGNGATGGGVGTQSGTQYYNNGNTSNCSFQVQRNGFSRSGYTFSYWTGGGTNYNPGGWITIGDSFTLYAAWYRTPVTNYTLASGSGKKGATTMYFDTTGYSSVTITIHVWSVWAWVYFINYASDMSGMPYTFYAKEGTETTRSISLSANAGAQPFSFKVNPESGYGGNDGNTSWSITVTAS